jgi:hypothetical protein
MHVMQLEAHRFANEILAQEPPEELQIEAA